MMDVLDSPDQARATHRRLLVGRLLVAEDDEEMRRLLASSLSSHGYEVVEAADGKELIDRLSESMVSGAPVDCIITDVRMPRLTGSEALKFIKRAGLKMPVIVITAFGDHATRIDAWLAGASAVLDNPFEIERLLDEIRLSRLGSDGEDHRPPDA